MYRTITIGTHGVETTVSEMRKRLARTLSNMPGDDTVFFTLTVHRLEKPAPSLQISHGELARPENN